MLKVEKNQVRYVEYVVEEYINGEYMGVISGMGRNNGTWDANAKSKRTAQRWAAICRKDSPNSNFYVSPR